MKFSTWRSLWVALAEAQRELGLPITEEQIKELKEHVENINFEQAEAYERKFRHDVMAHIHAYGDLCPKARPIIHLGATSAFVGDNADIIIMDNGLRILKKKLINIVYRLSQFALEYKDMPTLGFTHFQPAQLTTVGKRACLWIQDFLIDLKEMDYRLSTSALRGAKGTTGTQASFMALFEDKDKVLELDNLVADKMGYNKVYPVTGQTYTRKLDHQILSTLSGIAQSAHKFSNDIRLLQSLKEIEEPFEKNQIGSSAMAYKRNPMRSERVASLARYVILSATNPGITAASQWFERTLDDSANRRLVIPEVFLAVDAILSIVYNIVDGLVVYPKVIEKNIMEELPFMATENIMMECVKRGEDRQEIHELIRIHSIEASKEVKINGSKNDLINRIIVDDRIPISEGDIKEIMDPQNYIGLAPYQTERFIKHEIFPIIEKYNNQLGLDITLKV